MKSKKTIDEELDDFELEQAMKSPDPKSALELYELMGELSRQCCSASWKHNLEFDLWKILIDTKTPKGMAEEKNRTIYRTVFTVEQINNLRKLAKESQGWWFWNEKHPDWGAAFLKLDISRFNF